MSRKPSSAPAVNAPEPPIHRFGSRRPRVQIPPPRPKSPGQRARPGRGEGGEFAAGSQSVATARLIRTQGVADDGESATELGTLMAMVERTFHKPDPATVLARLREQVKAARAELAAVEQELDEIEALVAPPTPETTLLTVEETARVLRVSRTRVFELLAAHDLDGVMIGKRRLVPRKSVEAFLSRLGAL